MNWFVCAYFWAAKRVFVLNSLPPIFVRATQFRKLGYERRNFGNGTFRRVFGKLLLFYWKISLQFSVLSYAQKMFWRLQLIINFIIQLNYNYLFSNSASTFVWWSQSVHFPLPQYTRKLPCMTTEISHKRCDRSIICIWGEVWDLFITLVLYQSIRKILRKSLFAS